MIEVTKFNGESIIINAEHIESIEANPDTTLVLGNGKHLVIRENVPTVLEKVVAYQRQIRSGMPAVTAHPDRTPIG